MSILDSRSAALTILIEDPLFEKARWRQRPSWPGTAVGPWTPTAMTYGPSSSGPPISMWPFSSHRPHIELYRTSMEDGDLARRRSTADCRRSVPSPLRSHRRTVSAQPGPVRQTARGPPFRGPRSRPPRVPDVPLRRRTVRSGRCRLGRAARAQRPPSERGMWDLHRRPRFRPWARTLRIMGKGSRPAVIPLVPRAAGPSIWRSESAQTARSFYDATGTVWIDAPLTARSAPSASGRSSDRPSPHAPVSLHHGRSRRRRPPSGRPDRCPPCRSEDDDDLRPETRELRPSRRLCRCGLRGRRVDLDAWGCPT